MGSGLRQSDVALLLCVRTDTVTGWELGRTEPEIQFYPPILEFLGYDPFTEPVSLAEQLLWLKRRLGLPRIRLAERLGVDVSTIRKWELDEHRPTRKLQERIDNLVLEVKSASGFDHA